MAISLTSDGLNLNYPTSTVSTYEAFPLGCAVVFEGTRYETNSAGTWAQLMYDELANNYLLGVDSIIVGKGTMVIGFRVA